ncbi:MAG: hypothetical protein U1F37_01790 [Alphaproteobacteria bacterium]
MRKGWIVGIAALMAVGAGGYFAADHFANAKVQQQAQIFARDMRKVTKEFRYGAVRADLLSQSIVMSDVEFVTLDGDRIRAASVAVKDFDWRSGGTPRYADIAIRRAEVPSTALASLARASNQLGAIVGVSTGPAAGAQRLLDRAGYGRTTSDIFVRYRLDEETGQFELSDVQLAVADLGEVLVNLRLGNVPARGIRDGAALLSAGTTTTLVHASVSFKDRSLVSRLLKAYAAERNLSEADALARVLADLRAERARARDAIEREALDALIRFVERPSEIRVALEPARPVPLLAMGLQFLGGRSFAKDAFGLKFSAR